MVTGLRRCLFAVGEASHEQHQEGVGVGGGSGELAGSAHTGAGRRKIGCGVGADFSGSFDQRKKNELGLSARSDGPCSLHRAAGVRPAQQLGRCASADNRPTEKLP